MPLINNGKEIWVDSSGYHNMIIGSPDNYRLDILRKEMETIDRMIIKYNR